MDEIASLNVTQSPLTAGISKVKSKEAARVVAEEFESMFIAQMLAPMAGPYFVVATVGLRGDAPTVAGSVAVLRASLHLCAPPEENLSQFWLTNSNEKVRGQHASAMILKFESDLFNHGDKAILGDRAAPHNPLH